MTPEEKQSAHVGPGGYKCHCCGPTPKERPKFRRTIRRRIKQLINKQIRKELRDG